MSATRSCLLIVVVCHLVAASVFAIDDPLDKYNVVWTSPSKDYNGSMPIGNGEIGLNVWVESNGDLVFLCGRTDSWNENMRLCKIGRVRIRFMPPLAGGRFEKVLRLRQGEIAIAGGPVDSPIKVRLWPDAHGQVVYVEAESSQAFRMKVALEMWRNRERMYNDVQFPPPAKAYPDTILTDQKDQIVWYHRNPVSTWRETLELQRLQPAIEMGKDPLLHRTFGGLIRGKGLMRVDDKTLKTVTPGKQFRIAMHTHTMTPATKAEWLAAIKKNAAAAEAIDIEQVREAHRQWWDRFWSRSWIRATGTPAAEVATRSYILQRFITAGAGRGHFPIKFNGSIFTVDGAYQGGTCDPDYRLWGGCYWFQNTRLIYWPMLASGDFEMMWPLFRMYEDALPLARVRNKIYFNHEGCFFPEMMTFYGCYDNGSCGWGQRKGGKPGDPIPNVYIRYHYNNTLELLAMMLDYYNYTEDKEFLHKELLPIADECLLWWDKHWSRDHGKLRMSPSNALETYWGVATCGKTWLDSCGISTGCWRFPMREIGVVRRAWWNNLWKALLALTDDDSRK